MNAEIKLTKMLPPAGNMPSGSQQAWPLVIQAAGKDIPDEIFVYQVGQNGDPKGDLETGDRFSCVASMPQMSEIPRFNGRALGEWTIPFYRSSQLRVVCRNAADVERVWRIVQEDTQALVENWNASWLLQGVERVRVDDQSIVAKSLNMNPPTLLYLNYRPAGTATVSEEGQGITGPDSSLGGWLPVSAAPDSWIKPEGAIFFYNVEQDEALKKLWPMPEPMSGNLLHRNGILMPYGITHLFDRHTIWWLEFTPSNLPGYQHLEGQSPDSAAPWPEDYVDSMNPGSITPNLTLTVFADAD